MRSLLVLTLMSILAGCGSTESEGDPGMIMGTWDYDWGELAVDCDGRTESVAISGQLTFVPGVDTHLELVASAFPCVGDTSSRFDMDGDAAASLGLGCGNNEAGDARIFYWTDHWTFTPADDGETLIEELDGFADFQRLGEREPWASCDLTIRSVLYRHHE